MREKDSLKVRAIVDEVFPNYPEADRVKATKRIEGLFKRKDGILRKYIEVDDKSDTASQSKQYLIKPEYKTMFCNLAFLNTFISDNNVVLELLFEEQSENVSNSLNNLISNFSYRMRLYQMGINLFHKLKTDSESSELNLYDVKLHEQIEFIQTNQISEKKPIVKTSPLDLHALQVLEDVEKSVDYDPGSADDMVEKARYYIRIDQPRPAQKLLYKVLAKEPNQSFALMLMAQLLLQFKDKLVSQGNSYHLWSMESDACSAAERHYDELASDSYADAFQHEDDAFKLMIKALQNWPEREGYSGVIIYEESDLRDLAVTFVLKKVAVKCDPDHFDFTHSDKMYARLGTFVEKELRSGSTHLKLGISYGTEVKQAQLENMLIKKAEELKAEPLFDVDIDVLVSKLAAEVLQSRPIAYGDISGKVINQINAMCTLKVLPVENMNEMKGSYWENLNSLARDNPDLLIQLATAGHRVGKSFRQQLVETESVPGALKLIDRELNRTFTQHRSGAFNAKQAILEELVFYYYKRGDFELSYEHCSTIVKLLADKTIEHSNHLRAKWKYSLVRTYIDANPTANLNDQQKVGVLQKFMDLHEQDVVYLLKGKKEYMVPDCETYDCGGFRNFEADPFGREEDDIFSVTIYSDVNECLSKDFIRSCLCKSCSDETRGRAKRLIDLICRHPEYDKRNCYPPSDTQPI